MALRILDRDHSIYTDLSSLFVFFHLTLGRFFPYIMVLSENKLKYVIFHNGYAIPLLLDFRLFLLTYIKLQWTSLNAKFAPYFWLFSCGRSSGKELLGLVQALASNAWKHLGHLSNISGSSNWIALLIGRMIN